jgi:hypothetical protein
MGPNDAFAAADGEEPPFPQVPPRRVVPLRGRHRILGQLRYLARIASLFKNISGSVQSSFHAVLYLVSHRDDRHHDTQCNGETREAQMEASQYYTAAGLIASVPSSRIRIPIGNTGRARVHALKSLRVPDELRDLVSQTARNFIPA